MPMVGPGQRSRSRSPRHETRPPSTERRTAAQPRASRRRGRRGRPCRGWHRGRPRTARRSRAHAARAPRQARARAREPHGSPLRRAAVRARSRRRRSPRSEIHTRIIASRRRSPARRRARRRVDRALASSCKKTVERLDRSGGDAPPREARRGAEAAPLPVLGSLDEAMPRGVAKCVATGSVELLPGDDGPGVVRALEEHSTRVMSPVEAHRIDALGGGSCRDRALPVRPGRRSGGGCRGGTRRRAPTQRLPTTPSSRSRNRSRSPASRKRRQRAFPATVIKWTLLSGQRRATC